MKHLKLKSKDKLSPFPDLISFFFQAQTKVTTVLLLASLSVHSQNAKSLEAATNPKLNSPNVSFIENKGQVRDQNEQARPDVLFSGCTQGMVYHLRNNGISYQLHRKTETQSEIYRLDVNWLNINPLNGVEKDDALPGYDNFYKGNTPIRDVKTYKGVTYKNVYNNIDLHYYEKSGNLKYDYIVGPSANYKQIQMEIKGVERIVMQPDGGLLLKTPFGDILEGAPLVYQKGKKLNARWNVNHNMLSFDIDNYDPLLPLLIDPITRTWGTYYGAGNPGFLGTNGNGCSTDASGNVYFVGVTDATAGTGIATLGSHQATFSGGLGDGFLVMFNSAGVRQWGTYYGGTGGTTRFTNCAVDANGNVYAAGLSTALNGISTPGAHQAVSAGSGDGILVKFNNAGVRLWGTYYGGTGVDEFFDVATDISGDVYCTGRTRSSTGISTPGSHQSIFGAGTNTYDALLVKFNSSGVRQWGTYYGDTGDDWGYAIALDANSNIFIGGYTGSSTAIATPGSHQLSFGGGTRDGFLAKFNNIGVRQWGTYYGGSGADDINDIATASNGDIYAVGRTDSNSGISTPGSHLLTFGGGTYDVFLVKFNTSGVRQWGTYFGNSGDDRGAACSTDPFGNVIIVGETNSTTGVSMTGNHQTVFAGGTSDAFIAKFNSAGIQQSGSYYGGTSRDVAQGCAVDNTGTKLFLSGSTQSSGGTAIASLGSHQMSMAAANDAFLVLFSDCIGPNAPVNTTAVGNLTLCSNSSTTLSVTAAGPINWFSTPTSTVVLNTGGTFNTPALTSGTYTFFAATTNTCSASLRTAIGVTVNPLITVNSGAICSGASFTIVPGGVTSSTISGGSNIVNPTANTSYTVTGTDAGGCTGQAICNVSVNPIPTITVNSGTLCSGKSFTIQPNGANTYTVTGGSLVVSPTVNASYTVTGTNNDGCSSLTGAVSNLSVYASPTVTSVSSKTIICKGQSAILTASGAVTYSWSNGASSASITVSPTVTTTYTVTGTGANGCSSKITRTQSVSTCADLTENSGILISLNIVPNPNKGDFSIKTSLVLQNGMIEIYNSLGQLILREKVETNENNIRLPEQSPGIYLVRIIENNRIIGVSRMVKE